MPKGDSPIDPIFQRMFERSLSPSASRNRQEMALFKQLKALEKSFIKFYQTILVGFTIEYLKRDATDWLRSQIKPGDERKKNPQYTSECWRYIYSQLQMKAEQILEEITAQVGQVARERRMSSVDALNFHIQSIIQKALEVYLQQHEIDPKVSKHAPHVHLAVMEGTSYRKATDEELMQMMGFQLQEVSQQIQQGIEEYRKKMQQLQQPEGWSDFARSQNRSGGSSYKLEAGRSNQNPLPTSVSTTFDPSIVPYAIVQVDLIQGLVRTICRLTTVEEVSPRLVREQALLKSKLSQHGHTETTRQIFLREIYDPQGMVKMKGYEFSLETYGEGWKQAFLANLKLIQVSNAPAAPATPAVSSSPHSEEAVAASASSNSTNTSSKPASKPEASPDEPDTYSAPEVSPSSHPYAIIGWAVDGDNRTGIYLLNSRFRRKKDANAACKKLLATTPLTGNCGLVVVHDSQGVFGNRGNSGKIEELTVPAIKKLGIDPHLFADQEIQEELVQDNPEPEPDPLETIGLSVIEGGTGKSETEEAENERYFDESKVPA